MPWRDFRPDGRIGGGAPPGRPPWAGSGSGQGGLQPYHTKDIAQSAFRRPDAARGTIPERRDNSAHQNLDRSGGKGQLRVSPEVSGQGKTRRGRPARERPLFCSRAFVDRSRQTAGGAVGGAVKPRAASWHMRTPDSAARPACMRFIIPPPVPAAKLLVADEVAQASPTATLSCAGLRFITTPAAIAIARMKMTRDACDRT